MRASTWYRYHALIREHGLQLTTHDHARSFTLWPLLLEAGTHRRVVAESLGHANPALVLSVYGHVTDRMQKDATAALEGVLGPDRTALLHSAVR